MSRTDNRTAYISPTKASSLTKRLKLISAATLRISHSARSIQARYSLGSGAGELHRWQPGREC